MHLNIHETKKTINKKKEEEKKMVSKKPRIVIIGAGMAGLTAANKLYTSTSNHFELSVVEGSGRIGGRINSSEFCGDGIEQGATWIHGIEGSPVYKIAQQTNSLHSDQPWECMDGILKAPVTVAEGGHELSPSFVDPISSLFKNLMDFIQGKEEGEAITDDEILKQCAAGENLSVGAFLRRGLEAYLSRLKEDDGKMVGNWSGKCLRRGIFAMHESIQRTFTSAHDLNRLDYNAEREYAMFPGEEITIAKGYSSVVEALAAVLPPGMIQFGRRVERVEWRDAAAAAEGRQVKLHFCDGTSMSADHVIVTVSLGVLKRGIINEEESSMVFHPPLPSSKARAISRLGYGVVNKVFLQLSEEGETVDGGGGFSFPFPLQMVFHEPDSDLRNPEIPHWIRRTSFLSPIYSNSRVVLSWFTGQEALEIEQLPDEDIIVGFESTVSNLLPPTEPELTQRAANGDNFLSRYQPKKKVVKFERVLRTKWGTNPLFLGSYSYVAVGSSTDDMDVLAEPLPSRGVDSLSSPPPLQILFAGEATHRTHYSTTHGAYFSGLREANRLLKHYNYNYYFGV